MSIHLYSYFSYLLLSVTQLDLERSCYRLCISRQKAETMSRVRAIKLLIFPYMLECSWGSGPTSLLQSQVS